MIGRISAAVFGFWVGFGLTAAAAVTMPALVAAVAGGLENAGYTDVRVTERVFGGFAIEGTKDADFAIIVVDYQGIILDHAELFRDADGDGVFEVSETLGLPGSSTLRDLIFEALAASAEPTQRNVNVGTLDVPGFGQNRGSLFATGGLRLDAGERLGSGSFALLDQGLSLGEDGDGLQRRGVSQKQLLTMTGLGMLTLSATATGPGGQSGSFAPLSVNLPGAFTSGANVEDIRSKVAGSSPDSQVLRAAITAVAPSAADLIEQIKSNVPTAEVIHATITTPTVPVGP
jgi:hypothetical protein